MNNFFRVLSLSYLLSFFIGVAASAPEGNIIHPQAFQSGVSQYYSEWKKRYLRPSMLVPGDYKIAFTPSGSTVSEAMGYGMLIAVMMADTYPQARHIFDGLDRFRKRYPSNINPAFMAWKIPANEKNVSNDSATDGDMDMAMALLLAHQKWNDPVYLAEAKVLIHALGESLVRPDGSLRLGDWDTDESKRKMIRTSDLIPTHFRAFHKVSGDQLWLKVEDRAYAILEQLQRQYAPKTGLVPDFAIGRDGTWEPAKPRALEGSHDGEYSYNACRMPWRIGWASLKLRDERAGKVVNPFMAWAKSSVRHPEDFKAGYHLGGKMLKGADFDSPCFISPTGVAAMAMGDHRWSNAVKAYALKAHEGYYEDSVNLLCLLVMLEGAKSLGLEGDGISQNR